MAWNYNNNRQFTPNNYNNFRPQQNGNFHNRGFGNNYNNQQPQNRFKKSGYKVKQMQDGSYVCSGWLKNKEGLWEFYARPYKGTHEVESKNGNKFLNLFVTVRNKQTFQEIKTSGLLNLTNKKLIMKDLKLLGTPAGGGMTRGGHRITGSIVPLRSK